MMAVVFVMDGELTQLFAFKFSSAVRTDVGKYFQRASAVRLFVFTPYHAASLHERGDSAHTWSTLSLWLEHPTCGEIGTDTVLE